MNVFSFTGSIGKDCVKRYTPKNDAVTSFSVAVNSGYGDKQVTSWVNCTVWGKQAESLEPYLLKSTKVAVSGELTLRQYENKDGTKGHSLDVRVSSVTLLGSKGDTNTPAEKESAPKERNADPMDFESDDPF